MKMIFNKEKALRQDPLYMWIDKQKNIIQRKQKSNINGAELKQTLLLNNLSLIKLQALLSELPHNKLYDRKAQHMW